MPAFLLLLLAAIALPPKPDRYVTDKAEVLGLQDNVALNERLTKLKRQNSVRVLLYIDRELPPGTTIEQLGSEAMRRWAGPDGNDHDVLVLLYTQPEEMRIEAGEGSSGASDYGSWSAGGGSSSSSFSSSIFVVTILLGRGRIGRRGRGER